MPRVIQGRNGGKLLVQQRGEPSFNPSGRPKGSRNRSTILREMLAGKTKTKNALTNLIKEIATQEQIDTVLRGKSLQCVYVMSVAEKFYKIGISSDASRRLSTLQGANPLKVTLVATYTCSDACLMEQSLHQKYAHKRMHGEWFELDDADLKEIEVYVNESENKDKTKINA